MLLDSPTQIATQIRFHLETLGETNAHHPFEQLCLGLTRRRIVSNVLPATGPVSAGGDGGRDAESFWSVLARELPDTSLFTTLATDESVVLAVTTQRTDVPTKVRSDLAKICGKGEPVDRVIYFTVVAIDTAKRHDLQQHAREQHSVELDIWDAQAIANEIASPDLFYLAVDYLHVPSTLAPAREDTDDDLPPWYIEERERWRKQPTCAGSTGELVDLREGLRFATRNPHARADLPDWLAAARHLRNAALDDHGVLNRVEYELIIGTGLVLNTLEPVDEILRDYFARLVSDPPDPGVLFDAVTLLRLTEATLPRRKTSITAEQAAQWADDLERVIETELQSAPGPNAQASLLVVAVILAIGPRALSTEQLANIDSDAGPTISNIYDEITEAHQEGRAVPTAPDDADLRNLDLGMTHLAAFVEALPSAPMAPLEELTTMFDIAAPALVDHPEYHRLRQALDEATVERSGRAVAGDRAQSRAVGMLQTGRPLDALREIHAAKLNWLNGDAAEGAALMMLLAADVYYKLGLPIAAKQYAMSAATLAKTSNNPNLAVLVARGIIVAATCEHLAGQWLTATRTFRVGIWAQSQLAGEPWSRDRYPYFWNMLTDQCFILRVASSLRPNLLPAIEPSVESTDLDAMTGPMLASVAHLRAHSEDEVADAADRGGMGRPFSDAGPTREYSWAALGNTWIVTTSNDRHHVLAAERFVSAAQIMLADMAGEDLLLVPGEIRIEVEVSAEPLDPQDVFTPEGDRSPGAVGHLVLLTRGGVLDTDDDQIEVAAAALQVLVTQSLLGQRAFTELMERTFERGLPHMLTCVRPYDELVDLHRDDLYDEFRQIDGHLIAPDRPRNPKPADGLEQTGTKPHPAYDEDERLADIESGYEVLLPPVRFTVRRLADDPTFMALVTSLRAQGWKDWHLLTAVANIAVNVRAVQRGLNMTTSITEADVKRFRAIFNEGEREGEVIPVDRFTEHEMWFHLGNTASATARRWGLEVRVSLLDPRPFLSVLGDRFNYWTDDVEHQPVFPSTPPALPR